MADSKISLCSSALNLIGEPAIGSLAEGTDAARVCAQLYDNLKWTLLASYPWSFSKKKAQLQRLIAPPNSRWASAFQLPTDRVSDVFALYPSDRVGVQPISTFEVQGAHTLYGGDELWIDYQYNASEGNFPPYFSQFLIYVLASNFAEPITEQQGKGEYWHEIAYGTPSENMRGGYFRVAANIDARGHPPPVFYSDELIDARFAG